jgi:hypothetical protein
MGAAISTARRIGLDLTATGRSVRRSQRAVASA